MLHYSDFYTQSLSGLFHAYISLHLTVHSDCGVNCDDSYLLLVISSSALLPEIQKLTGAKTLEELNVCYWDETRQAAVHRQKLRRDATEVTWRREVTGTDQYDVWVAVCSESVLTTALSGTVEVLHTPRVLTSKPETDLHPYLYLCVAEICAYGALLVLWAVLLHLYWSSSNFLQKYWISGLLLISVVEYFFGYLTWN